MMLKVNWKWPRTKLNNLLPWYIIAKNLCGLPFYLIGAAFVFVGYLIVYGPRVAVKDVKSLLF